MSADINTLMQQVHDYFLNLFHQKSGSTPGNAFLLFEPIGTPLTSDMFKLHATDTAYSPAVAVEEFSSLVNTIPDIGADTFQRTDKQVDDFYYGLLAGSLPVDTNNALFTTLKGEALKRFEPTLPPLLKLPVPFHPSYATPTDWYDPTVDGNWPKYTFKDGQSKTTTTENGPPPPILPIHPIRPWTWRVLPVEAVDVLSEPDRVNEFVAKAGITVNTNPEKFRFMHAPVDLAPETSAETTPEKSLAASETSVAESSVLSPSIHEAPILAEKSMLTSPIHEAPILAESSALISPIHEAILADSGELTPTPSSTEGQSNTVEVRKLSLLRAAELTPALDQYISSQTVASNTLTVTFNYCLITVERPWFSQVFLDVPNWYVPGYQAGAFSAGTAQNNAGLFPVLPVACLVIKDLQITAQWSQDDITAIQRAAAFGPFSLIGRTVDSGMTTLSTTGMQVTGWICQVIPLLPPMVPPA